MRNFFSMLILLLLANFSISANAKAIYGPLPSLNAVTFSAANSPVKSQNTFYVTLGMSYNCDKEGENCGFLTTTVNFPNQGQTKFYIPPSSLLGPLLNVKSVKIAFITVDENPSPYGWEETATCNKNTNLIAKGLTPTVSVGIFNEESKTVVKCSPN